VIPPVTTADRPKDLAYDRGMNRKKKGSKQRSGPGRLAQEGGAHHHHPLRPSLCCCYPMGSVGKDEGKGEAAEEVEDDVDPEVLGDIIAQYLGETEGISARSFIEDETAAGGVPADWVGPEILTTRAGGVRPTSGRPAGSSDAPPLAEGLETDDGDLAMEVLEPTWTLRWRTSCDGDLAMEGWRRTMALQLEELPVLDETPPPGVEEEGV